MWFFIGIVAGALILGLIWFLQKNHPVLPGINGSLG